MRRVSYLLVLISLLISCSVKKTTSDRNLKELENWMTGTFSSAQQALEDQTYFDITLHMVPIWKNSEGHFLYVEQAVSSQQDKPYRQRVYQLERLGENQYSSRGKIPQAMLCHSVIFGPDNCIWQQAIA